MSLSTKVLFYRFLLIVVVSIWENTWIMMFFNKFLSDKHQSNIFQSKFDTSVYLFKDSDGDWTIGDNITSMNGYIWHKTCKIFIKCWVASLA